MTRPYPRNDPECIEKLLGITGAIGRQHSVELIQLRKDECLAMPERLFLPRLNILVFQPTQAFRHTHDEPLDGLHEVLMRRRGAGMGSVPAEGGTDPSQACQPLINVERNLPVLEKRQRNGITDTPSKPLVFETRQVFHCASGPQSLE